MRPPARHENVDPAEVESDSEEADSGEIEGGEEGMNFNGEGGEDEMIEMAAHEGMMEGGEDEIHMG